MRSYCALYVDAGYLLASAATRVTGTSLRGGVTVVYRDLIAALVRQAESESGLPVLRVNWYDASSKPGGEPDAYQNAIGMLPRVKLRLGRMSPGGEQKGVDLRIGLDLATQGRNRVADVMYLVSGDDDLTEAVEEAQSNGVQVVLLAAPNAQGQAHAVSRHLQREADGIVVIDPLTIDRAVTARKAPTDSTVVADGVGPDADAAGSAAAAAAVVGAVSGSVAGGVSGGVGAPVGADGTTPRMPVAPRPTPADFAGRKATLPALPKPGDGRAGAGVGPSTSLVYSSTTGVGSVGPVDHDYPADVDRVVDEVAAGVIETWSKTITEAERRTVLAERPSIPRELDKALLMDLSDRLGVYDIDERLRFMLRQAFWRHLD
jgi:uncharacterized LabA/DUF88 family protein